MTDAVLTEEWERGAGGGPGRQLRKVREAQGLELGTVAAQLRLSPATVDALERDDHSALDSPVFIRGYIRAYCRLLGVAEQPYIDALSSRLHAEAPPVPRPTGLVRRDRTSRDGWVRMVTFVVVLVTLGLLLVWLRGGIPPFWRELPQEWLELRWPEWIGGPPTISPESAPGEPGAAPGEGGQGRAAFTPGVDVTGLPESPMDEEPEPATGQDASPQEPAPARSDSARPTEPEMPRMPAEGSGRSAPPASMDQGLPRVPASQAGNAVPTPAPASPAAAEAVRQTRGRGSEGAPATPPVSGKSVLRISFSGDCWVDVRDASGDRVLAGLFHAGATQSVSGKPPFSVVLGNSSVTTIQLDGQPFDQRRFARGNVARFSVGQRTE